MQEMIASPEEIQGLKLRYCIQKIGQKIIRMEIDCKILSNEFFILVCLRRSNICKINSILQIIGLAIISCIVLGWLSWCQSQNIAFLNRALVELCQKLPSSNMNEQSLDED